VASYGKSRKRFGYRNAMLFVSVSTTWTRSNLVPTDTTDKLSCQEFASLHPPTYISAFILQLVRLYFLSVVFTRISYRLQNLFWDEGFILDEP
jgi:hypothetical protein